MKLSCCDRLSWVHSVTKTKQDNDVIDCKRATYAKKEIELLWPIRLGADCDQNKIRQRCDWSYKWSPPNIKLSCLYWSNLVRSVIKTRQDNDMTNCTRIVYAKNESELSWLIRLGAICNKNQIGRRRDRSYRFGQSEMILNFQDLSDVIDCIGVVYAKIETKLLGHIKSGVVC